ncbi:zinc finger protein [Saccharopolyspora shandongensis]|uniref:Zinc-finger n=2 Tax=Saccharopolyspora shandongensis TaxID=418495 RepID=A0A1H2RUZ4_9PSEU|nr:zinc-finger [Saccharopolyspora shandongensis]
MFGISSVGPVVYWRPHGGRRHALWPPELPRAGQTRETVCGGTITLADPSEVDWLDPTCEFCMAKARELRDARERGPE